MNWFSNLTRNDTHVESNRTESHGMGWDGQVTDFGLSRFKATSVSEKMTGQAGTYHWMAPEVINSQHYTEKADVFSYGIILWEIFTRAIPYGGMQPVQVYM